MPFSPTTIRELDSELVALAAERQRIDAKIAAIRALLNQPPVAGRTPPTPKRQAPIPRKKGSSGLRDAIADALRADPSGASAADVVSAVSERGITVDGKTPLKTRVYNELHRMKKVKQAKRTADGKYLLSS